MRLRESVTDVPNGSRPEREGGVIHPSVLPSFSPPSIIGELLPSIDVMNHYSLFLYIYFIALLLILRNNCRVTPDIQRALSWIDDDSGACRFRLGDSHPSLFRVSST